MKFHVFHYRWPRIREGLTHTEHELSHSWKVSLIKAPPGAFLTYEGKWHYKLNATTSWTLIEDHRVPKEIRAMALILPNQ